MTDRSHDTDTKRELCQYLLVCPEAIRAYIDALRITPADVVLEAGGGHGDITQEIVAHGPRRLETVDLDEGMAASLRQRFVGCENVAVTCGDGFVAIKKTKANALVSNLPISMCEQTLDLLFHSPSIQRCVMVADKRATGIVLPTGWEAQDIADFGGDDFDPPQPSDLVSHAVALWKKGE